MTWQPISTAPTKLPRKIEGWFFWGAPAYLQRAIFRKIAAKRQGGKCCYCGQKKKLTAEHIVPISKGGIDCYCNIAAACRECNQRRGNGPLPAPPED